MPQTSIGFVSFAGGHLRWKFASIRILRQIKASARFDSMEMYTEKKLHDIISPEIAQFISAHPKGYGLWIWKPIVVLDFLRRNPRCESILYLDAGCDFNGSESSRKRWEEYLSHLRHFNAVIFQTPHPEKSYTSAQLVTLLRSDLAHLECGQYHAGAFLMERSFAIKFCTDWLEVMSKENFKYLTDSVEGETIGIHEIHSDYRYDQSIFSLLLKKKSNIKILEDRETDFSPTWKIGLNYPVLTSRNRSIVPVLKEGLVHRGLRRVERRVIRTYNSYNEYLTRRKSKK